MVDDDVFIEVLDTWGFMQEHMNTRQLVSALQLLVIRVTFFNL
jgi:hypothetical protein